MNFTRPFRFLSVFFIFFLIVIECDAQFYRYRNPWFRQGRSGMLMNNFVTYSTRGTKMLNQDYMLGRIEFNKNLPPMEGFYINYDLQNNQIEVKTEGANVKKIDMKLVKSFELYNETTSEIRHFENGFQYLFEGVPLVGIYEVLVEGKTPLFARWSADVTTSNNMNGFDFSVDVQKSIKIEQQFYAVNGKEVFLLHKNPKKNDHIFGGKQNDMELMIKEKKLKLKGREDVKEVFEYYNSIL